MWEVAHLPLYTLWHTASGGKPAPSVLHCTGGDVLIALSSFGFDLLAICSSRWPADGFGRMLLTATLTSVVCTLVSEWWNVGWRGALAYASAMPRLPWIGTGVTSFLQWVLLPPLCLWGGLRLSERDPISGAR